MGLGIHLNSRVTHIDEKQCSPKQAIYLNPEDEIRLNVGGEIFATKVGNLTRIPGTVLARMVDRMWKNSSSSEPIFIDRDPKYFGLLLDFLSNKPISLPKSEKELAGIVQEAEFFQVDELISKIVREDRRCFGEGPPLFPKDRVLWKNGNFWRMLSENGWNFDGRLKAVPLCFTYFTLFSPNEVCYMCGVETKDLNGFYKSVFDFPRDFTSTVGEIDKIYGDCCCCDVRFGKSSFIFHVPTKLLRLAE